MTEHIIFMFVITASNIFQGITGFAGTILAMPFGLMLVGYDTAKPLLNFLTLLSGIYVFLGNRKAVNRKELLKIIAVMSLGLFTGFFVKSFFTDTYPLEVMLGIFVIFLAIKGLFFNKKNPTTDKPDSMIKSGLLLASSGLVHGIFVSGGPLLIGYLSKKVTQKVNFRATISTVWIFTNSVVLAQELIQGDVWDPELFKWFLVGVPFLFTGMIIGTKLYHKMSQELFMKLTYILLLVAGVTLFF